MIDLSIIIVNRNVSKFLEECLSSIYRSTHVITFEIIFIDNHSTDNSLEIVRSKFPDVSIIENQHNLGFCRANNQGLKIYQGRYALLLNADTIVADRALDRMLIFIDKNLTVGAAGPRLLNPDGSIQRQGGRFGKKFWLADKPTIVDFVVGACLMVKREAINMAGVMDENFFFGNDDLDWCRRIRKAGWEIYYLPQAEVTHYGGFTTKRFDRRLLAEGFRGGLYFAKKQYGWMAYEVYRLTLFFLLSAAILGMLLIYPFLKNKGIVGAYFDVLKICLKGEIILDYEKNPFPD